MKKLFFIFTLITILWFEPCRSFYHVVIPCKFHHIGSAKQISSKGFAPSSGGTQKDNSKASKKDKQKHHLTNADFQVRNQNNNGRKWFVLPWWMREEESKNPDILPKYNPWWKSNNFKVDLSWPLKQLLSEAHRRDIDVGCSKEELVERINKSFEMFSLGNENFRAPTILESANVTAPCYPEVYERQPS